MSDDKHTQQSVSTATTKVFLVVMGNRNAYPGHGLKLTADPPKRAPMDTEILDAMHVDLREGDEIEITVRHISRVEPARRVLV